jgi:hypothetical protein
VAGQENGAQDEKTETEKGERGRLVISLLADRGPVSLEAVALGVPLARDREQDREAVGQTLSFGCWTDKGGGVMPKRVNRRVLRMGIITGLSGVARQTRSPREKPPRPTSVTECWLAGYRDTEARGIVATITYDRDGNRVGPIRTEARCSSRPAALRYDLGVRIQYENGDALRNLLPEMVIEGYRPGSLARRRG